MSSPSSTGTLRREMKPIFKFMLLLFIAGEAYPQSANPIINEYVIPTANSQPLEITLGPDGALWFTEYAGNKIGRITTAGVISEYPVPTPSSQPVGITAGPDGALWFTESAANKIGRIDPIHKTITEYPVPTASAQPYGIASGPDGALWFTEASSVKIGRITTAGVVTEYEVPFDFFWTNTPHLDLIAAGPGGTLWFTENGPTETVISSVPGHEIGQITVAGVITIHEASGGNTGGIALGFDSALWFTVGAYSVHGFSNYGGSFGRITTAGGNSMSDAPWTSPPEIAAGPDGAMWFTGDVIGQITLTGAVTEFPLPFGGAHGITSGTNNTLWFAGGGNAIGSILIGSSVTVSPTSTNFPANGGTGTVIVTVTPSDATWTALANVDWITITSGSTGTGSGTAAYLTAANNSISSRSGTLVIAGQAVTVTQAGMLPTFSISPTAASVSASGGTGTVTVTAAPPDATWTAVSNVTWITITSGNSGTGNGTVGYSVTANASTGSRSGSLTIAGQTFTLTQAGMAISYQGLSFYPVAPCRIADTRSIGGMTGAFGPPAMSGGSTRVFPISVSSCAIPSSALAYSLNITVIPPGPLIYLSIWPSDQSQPTVSTLNSFDGRVVANAAIVSAAWNGAVSLYVSNTTDVILDINGYFAAPSLQGLAFYPVTPCRVADTRSWAGMTGAFGSPSLVGGATRDFPIPTSSCGIPASAKAYSLNMTVVPPGPLIYLSTGPAGQPLPGVSTLNSFDGSVVANAAIVPAGSNGSISVFASNPTDLIIDVNGYFAPPGSPGALAFYPATPCRLVDTRGNGMSGAFGPPSMAANSARSFPLLSASCGIPASAQAYALNFTVVPPGPLSWLSAWATGTSPGKGTGDPGISTLNSYLGRVVANAAIVPAGTSGSISVYVSDATDLIIDANGYFAPSSASQPVDLSLAYNRTGISTDGVTFSKTSGLDNQGTAYSANLLRSTQFWNGAQLSGAQFNLGPPNVPDTVTGAGNAIALPAGKFSWLIMLATGVTGNQAAQTFTVTYSDGTTSSFTQSLSDWYTPQNYPGEFKAVAMPYRDYFDGTQQSLPFYLYGYSLSLYNAKTVTGFRLPNNGNVAVLALTLVP